MPDGPMKTFGEFFENESMTSILFEFFKVFNTSASVTLPPLNLSMATNIESGGWCGFGLLSVSKGVVDWKLVVEGAIVGRLVVDGRLVVAGLVGNSWTSF